MNKVRLIGIAMMLSGIFIGYLSTRTDLHLLSGILLGLGIGWLITGKFNAHHRKVSTRNTRTGVPVKSNR
ncbi:hypothetical protein [Christiangramia aquimixticola]|uniref:hypothetical protein n=1 Tax=Christiangramia aquimixticola TaxID=1697558 RepID=UPI003AA7BE32